MDTLSLVEEVRFDSAFTFIYSPRSGTTAAKLPGRIDPDTARDRITRLIAVQEKITAEVFESLIGQEALVLSFGASHLAFSMPSETMQQLGQSMIATASRGSVQ